MACVACGDKDCRATGSVAFEFGENADQGRVMAELACRDRQLQQLRDAWDRYRRMPIAVAPGVSGCPACGAQEILRVSYRSDWLPADHPNDQQECLACHQRFWRMR